MSRTLLHHHREGDGPPLVLIHGIGATWQCWKPVIGPLAEQHDVIAVDLPGFGGSTALQVAQPSLRQMADAVLALLDSLEIERFHVAGNSMGGAVGIELLPSGRVLSYSGISSAGMTYGPVANIVTKPLLNATYFGTRLIHPLARPLTTLRPLRALLLSGMLGHPMRATQADAIDLIDGCAKGTGFRPTLTHALKNEPLQIPAWDGPAQMLWGTRDRVLPLRPSAGRFTEAWPGLRLIELHGLGHVPMAEDPHTITRLIARHAANAEPRANAAPAPPAEPGAATAQET